MMQIIAGVPQGIVNSSIGVCALVLALYHAGRLRGEYAQIILGVHSLHVMQALGAVGLSSMTLLICLI